MKKPDSLRAVLMAMVPGLAQRPDNLEMWVEHGRIAATGERSNGWRWHYTLRVLIKDFSEDINRVILPLIPWLRQYQPELLRNPDRNKTGLKYQIDQLNHSSCDILLDIECRDAKLAQAAADQFPRWNRAGGHVVAGLSRRRAAERDMFLS